MPPKPLKQYGLIPQDYREIIRARATTHQVFGSMAPSTLLSSLVIPDYVGPTDQGATPFCFAYCTRQLLSDQHGVLYDENWNVAKSAETWGQSVVIPGGCPALVAMDAMVAFGPLRASEAPQGMTWEERSPEFVADYKNWPAILDRKAAPDEEGSVFPVDGPYDDFDNVRSYMQMHKRHVAFATKWYQGFNYPGTDGIIAPIGTASPENPDAAAFSWHMYEAMDFDTINGIEYIRIKPHEGIGYGKGGYAYLDRATVNTLIGDPQAAALVFSDAPASIVDRMRIQALSLQEIFEELVSRIEGK